MTQKLINVLNEDDTQKVEDFIKDFKDYHGNGIKVLKHTKEDNGVTMVVDITSSTLSDDLVNEKLKVIATDIQSKGYGDLNIMFSVEGINYKPDTIPDLSINALTYQPHQIKQNLIYGRPTIQDILMGIEDVKIDSDVIPKVGPETLEWIRIKKKRCMTAYEVLKKGSINGVSYRLEPLLFGKRTIEPIIWPNYTKTLPKDTLNQLQLRAGIQVSIVEVGDIDVLPQVIDGIKEKFEKFDCNVSIYNDIETYKVYNT